MTYSATYRVRHETAYTYTDVVASSYGRCYLTPREMPGQRMLAHEVAVTPEPTDLSFGPDVYGNTSAFFHVSTEHTALTVVGDTLVEVTAPEPDSVEDLPWELARPTGAEGALAVEFTLDLVTPEITEDLRQYAAPTFQPGRPVREVALELTQRIYADFTYRSGSTTISTRVAEVLRERSGVCQDFARVAIACLRANGLAARYVSGYLATTPPPGKERMIGADATHAWAAVWLPGDRWLAFDPTNNQFADERYVTVAWGRDYADVPPLRGIIYTDAKGSTIKVSVDVAPQRAQELANPGNAGA